MTEETSDTLRKKAWIISDALDDLEREERQVQESLEHYQSIRQRETELLEEVAYFSEGTVVANRAIEQLDTHHQIEQKRQRNFEELTDEIQRQKKALSDHLQDVENQIKTLEEGETDDED